MGNPGTNRATDNTKNKAKQYFGLTHDELLLGLGVLLGSICGPILFSFTAIVIYQRFAMYLRFEITHPLQDKLLNFNGL